MNIWREFKEFALKGSVLDLAVGVIIGAAFNKIVSSLVDDIIMPPIGWALGNVDFSNLFLTLSRQDFDTLAQAKEAGAVTINYGLFINNIVSFFIVAAAVFLMVKQVNKLKRTPAGEDANATTRECPFCTTIVSMRATKCPACTSSFAHEGKK